jgi:hypothetical protein
VSCVVACIALPLVWLSAAPQTLPATAAAAEKSVGQIAQERFDLASRGRDIEVERYNRGLGTDERVAQWLRRRALAAIDLPDAAKRGEILRDYVQQMKKHIGQMQRSIQAGTANEEDLLNAQDRELEAELWLVRTAQANH